MNYILRNSEFATLYKDELDGFSIREELVNVKVYKYTYSYRERIIAIAECTKVKPLSLTIFSPEYREVYMRNGHVAQSLYVNRWSSNPYEAVNTDGLDGMQLLKMFISVYKIPDRSYVYVLGCCIDESYLGVIKPYRYFNIYRKIPEQLSLIPYATIHEERICGSMIRVADIIVPNDGVFEVGNIKSVTDVDKLLNKIRSYRVRYIKLGDLLKQRMPIMRTKPSRGNINKIIKSE